MTGKFCQLVCVPGTGKTTILRQLSDNEKLKRFHLGAKNQSTKFVYINLQELTDFAESQVIKFLLFSLGQKVEHEGEILQLKKRFKETVVKICQKFTLILLFDHFDEIQNHLTRSFHQLLEDVKDLAKYKFAVVFGTRRNLQDLVDEQITRDFWSFFLGNAVYLKVSDENATKFMFSQSEKAFGKKLTDKQKSAIVEQSGGHAKITKILSELVLAENIGLGENLILQKPQIRASLFEIWLFLTAEEQRALYLSSQGKTQIETHVSEKLTKLDLIDEKQNFTIPLFGEFVKTMAPDVAEPKIVFDPITKEIVKGESIISELLSPQEYRLMRFLIGNKEQIVERDELIAAVWPHAQMKDAVSDEAIDQMILRLRKKIENEPKKPKHLITVKGRGIRFIP